MLTAAVQVLAAAADHQAMANPQTILISNPVVANSLVASIFAAVVAGAGWVVRRLLANKKARAALAAAGKSALGIEDPKPAEVNHDAAALRSGLAQLITVLQDSIRHERAERIADSQERARQEDRRWERVEDCVRASRETSENLRQLAGQQQAVCESVRALAESVHNAGRYFDEKHRENTAAHGQIIENQVHMSEYLQANLPPVVSAWGRMAPGGRRRPASGEEVGRT